MPHIKTPLTLDQHSYLIHSLNRLVETLSTLGHDVSSETATRDLQTIIRNIRKTTK